MPVNYISPEDAFAAPGLRMVVVTDVPSPWGEAAKGIFHIKGIDWQAVRLVYDNKDLRKWAGGGNGPIAVYDNEKPRSGWAEILLLAERLAPTPSLIPEDAKTRAMMFGLSHELLGEGGLGWSRRLSMIAKGLQNDGGFPEPVAKYLGKKYGYSEAAAGACDDRVHSLLEMLAGQLREQEAAGSDFYLGDALSAADIYSAAVMALFAPLPDDKCPMPAPTRKNFETLDDTTRAALDPILLAHRDMIYDRYLETPLTL